MKKPGPGIWDLSLKATGTGLNHVELSKGPVQTYRRFRLFTRWTPPNPPFLGTPCCLTAELSPGSVGR